MFIIHGFLFCFNFAAGVSYSVFPPEATVTTGEGIVLQVQPPDEPLQECSVRMGGYLHPLKPEITNNPMGVNYWGGGLEKGECGAIVQNFNATLHSGSWIFQLISSNGTTRSVKGTVYGIDDHTSDKSETIITEMGNEAVIPCDGKNAFYCILINPHNETIRTGTNCTLTLPNVKIADVGIWRCAEGVSNSVREEISEIKIEVHATKNLDIGQSEADNAINIFCNHLTKNISYCRFERPDGMVFLMADGRNFERYTYTGRGISNNDCVISIEKPLEEEDLGTWVCTLGLTDGGRSGGFVTLNSGRISSKILKTTQPQGVFILTKSALTLDCSVDTALTYCWFRHPNGTRFNAHPDTEPTSWQYHGDSLLLGQCGLTLLEAKITDSGTWTCGMGIQDEADASQDLQREINVRVADEPFIENRTVTTAMTGDWAILGCHSLQGEALQYCSFSAPNGTGFNLIPGKKRGRFTYHGNGLEYGDCGIMINPVKTEDYGTWQCGAMLAATKDGQEMMKNLMLEAPSLLSSSAAGLIAGIVVAVLLVAGFIFYRHRQHQRQTNRRHSTAQSARPVALSVLSDGSDEIDVHPAPDLQA